MPGVHRIKVYVGTSVFGGVFDEEFAEASKRFFERVGAGGCLVVLSQVTLDELAEAPRSVRQVLESLPDGSFVEAPVDDDAQALASAYIAAGALGEAFREDALHVAIATVAGADLIVSWNFRHIVNFSRIRKFNAVNLMNGYRVLDIRSPREMEYDDEDKDV